MKIRQQVRVVCLSMGLALSALAQDSLMTANSRKHDDDRRPPAAPEPALLLMAIGGVGVAGGYVALRLYRGRKKTPR
jgi:hypothetical protein